MHFSNHLASLQQNLVWPTRVTSSLPGSSLHLSLPCRPSLSQNCASTSSLPGSSSTGHRSGRWRPWALGGAALQGATQRGSEWWREGSEGRRAQTPANDGQELHSASASSAYSSGPCAPSCSGLRCRSLSSAHCPSQTPPLLRSCSSHPRRLDLEPTRWGGAGGGARKQRHGDARGRAGAPPSSSGTRVG